MAKRRQRSAGKRKVKRIVLEGQAHIYSTFNNTIVTITDMGGNALAWASAGSSAGRIASSSVLRIASSSDVIGSVARVMATVLTPT